MTPDDLSLALTELRMDRAQLARLCGVSPSTVSRWLRDPGEPGAYPVPRYAETIVQQARQLMRYRAA